MLELKKTVFFWLPLTAVLCGSASYLASDSSYVSDLEHLETSIVAMPAQPQQAKAGFLYQSATHP